MGEIWRNMKEKWRKIKEICRKHQFYWIEIGGLWNSRLPLLQIPISILQHCFKFSSQAKQKRSCFMSFLSRALRSSLSYILHESTKRRPRGENFLAMSLDSKALVYDVIGGERRGGSRYQISVQVYKPSVKTWNMSRRQESVDIFLHIFNIFLHIFGLFLLILTYSFIFFTYSFIILHIFHIFLHVFDILIPSYFRLLSSYFS